MEHDSEFDVIVVGLGGMGSAALYHLAGRGLRVLGLERFTIPHELGSSHGHTRIIRLAYYEHPSYVPLLRRAYQLWRSLEEESNRKLLWITGSIDAGPPGHFVFEGSKRSCELHGLPHDILSSKELSHRFPGYRLPEDTLAVFQPDGGLLTPEDCITSHVACAERRGAIVRHAEQVVAWEAANGGVTVQTDHRKYSAGKLVLTAGAWTAKVAPFLAPFLQVERQVLIWLAPHRVGFFDPCRFPVFNVAVPEGRFYGFPRFGPIPGFKFGRWHHLEEPVDPDSRYRAVSARDEAVLRPFAERYFPDGAGATLALAACMFTNTPDEHFIVDRHPEWPQIVVASPCSGHGFKFCSVIGEIIADLTTQGYTQHDIAMFRVARLTNAVDPNR